MKPYQKDNEFFACGTPITVAQNEQGETHVYHAETGERLSTHDLKFGDIYGGCENAAAESSSVEMKSGFVWRLIGGGKGEGASLERASVTLSGGIVGGYLFGAGVNDKVGAVKLSVSGGAVKWGLYGGGQSLTCGAVDMHFSYITCANVWSGTRNPDGCQIGDCKVAMQDGIVLNIYAGGKGESRGNIEICVTGGRIEKQIKKMNFDGQIDVTLWDGIGMDSSDGKHFPMLPEEAAVRYITVPPMPSEQIIARGTAAAQQQKPSHLDAVLDGTGEEGKLVFRFFELRDPAAPPESAFPEFIGDCFLISFPNGQQMLVDTGMPYAADEIISNLRAMNLHKIDWVMITHQHSDHNGSLAEILRRFAVDEVIFPDAVVPMADENAACFSAAVCEIAARGIPLRTVSRGDKLTVGDTEIDILTPKTPHAVSADPNDESIAIKVTWRQSSAVMGADIGEGTEVELTERYGKDLKCDLLKASHHGIVYQNHYRYIDACAPKYMVFHSLRPAGVFLRTTRMALNEVNHLSSECVFVTGECGAVKFVLDGEGGIKPTVQYEFE